MPPSNSVKDSGYLTPDSIPDERNLRSFSIPNDTAWLGTFMGALAPLMDSDAWRKFGALDPEQAAEEFQEIFFSWQLLACGCELPGGSRIIRLNPATGKVEELPPDGGAWSEPSGDYAVPAVPAREGGTAEDQICLAAANCANVLQQFYEQVSDSWNSGVSEAEALTDLVLLIVSLIGAEFAPITFAIVGFFALVFHYLYDALEFVGADLWDENFTKQLVCILVGCASNTAGVVTFDYACVNQAFIAQVNIFTLTQDQLRLYVQLQYLLSVIGGADALNQAGATTAITSYDCSECNPEWCIEYDFTSSNCGFSVYSADVPSVWTDGVGWVAQEHLQSGVSVNTAVQVYKAWAATANVTDTSVDFALEKGTNVKGDEIRNTLGAYNDPRDSFIGFSDVFAATITSPAIPTAPYNAPVGAAKIPWIELWSGCAFAFGVGGSASVSKMRLKGTGECPDPDYQVTCP